MASEKAPAFQFYPKDFLTDGKVAAMTLAERGAYITLLSICWLEGSLPDDPRRLAQMVGATRSEFQKLWPALAACFTVKGDALINKRLDLEREKQVEYRRRQSDAGRASANQRSTVRQPEVNHGSTGRLPEVNSPSPSSSSSPTSPTETIARVGPAFRTDGATAGMNPKDHLRHAVCDDTYSRCVPAAVHTKLRDLLAPKYGGDRHAAGDALRDWYVAVWATLPAEFVMGEAFKFWQGRFDAAFATVDATSNRKPLFSTTVQQDSEAVLAILHGQGGVPR
jgi:uncharacterized protein YdaU (DUF1376 family)